jgi:hypothetical protein
MVTPLRCNAPAAPAQLAHQLELAQALRRRMVWGNDIERLGSRRIEESIRSCEL